jgi:DNA-binding transcriptional regulator YiaG
MNAEDRLRTASGRWHGVAEMKDSVRALRRSARLTQLELAGLIGVPLETVRAWDSGRRKTPLDALTRVRSIAARRLEQQPVNETPAAAESVQPATRLFTLRALAIELGISVYTLREAARLGDLTVTYSTRVAFGRPVPLANRASADDYLAKSYGRRRDRRPLLSPPRLQSVPENFDVVLVGVRTRLRLTQADLAAAVGAANKAVVYQWESRKRRPSPVFWKRVLDLAVSSLGAPGQSMSARTLQGGRWPSPTLVR